MSQLVRPIHYDCPALHTLTVPPALAAAERRANIASQRAIQSNIVSPHSQVLRLEDAPTKEQHNRIGFPLPTIVKNPHKSISTRFPRRRRAALPLHPLTSSSNPIIPPTAASNPNLVPRQRRRQLLHASTSDTALDTRLSDSESGGRDEHSSSDDMSMIYITSSEEDDDEVE